MRYRIEVRYQDEIPDALGRGLVEDTRDLGISRVEDMRTAQVYWVTGDIDDSAIERLCSELLADAVTQVYHYGAEESNAVVPSTAGSNQRNGWTVEVRYKPGVTDTVGDSVMKGIQDMGIEGVQEVHTGYQYDIYGTGLTITDIEAISRRLLANELIQTISIREP